MQDVSHTQATSFGLPGADDFGVDTLAAEMAKLDREIAGPVSERPAWMQRPTAADLAAAAVANGSANNTPSYRSDHSRTSSFGEAPLIARLALHSSMADICHRSVCPLVCLGPTMHCPQFEGADICIFVISGKVCSFCELTLQLLVV